MYEPIIEIVQKNIAMDFAKEIETNIMRAVCDVGIEVNKEELIRALKYDRDQYEKGFQDGVASAQEWHPAVEPPNAMENPVLGDFCGIVCPVWYHAHSQEWETYGGMRETPRQWTKMPKPPKGVE